jgi:hypothetical protein
MERWTAETPDAFHRFEGDISQHPDFKGWQNQSHTKAFILLDGKLCDAYKQRARKTESRLCASACKKAHPLTSCSCICGGENHGVAYDGHEVVTELEQEAWDEYVDELVAPGM